MTRMPKSWWTRRLPANASTRTEFPTKADALRVFIERNRAVIDEFGGEDAVHRPAEFDAINHRFGLKGARQVKTIAGALWSALRGGPPWRLQDIDVALLNDTAPGQREGGFQLPDQVHEQIQQHAAVQHYEDQGIEGGLIDQCFDRLRGTGDGRFRQSAHARTVRGAKRERACVCRTPHGRFESCATRSAPAVTTRTPGPNAYEAKQEARRERYQQAARRAKHRAQVAADAALQAVEHIPMGQPILVGHHSERKHRAALGRRDRRMRKSIEERDKAARYARKAAAVGKTGVSSDDPDAIIKLEQKLADLEAKREAIKKRNREARKHGKEKAPAYMLANLGANIRRYRERIRELAAQRIAPEQAVIEGAGFRIWEDKEQNRLLLQPEARLDKAQHGKLRKAGFVYSRANRAYQRRISNRARYEAKRLAGELFGWVEGVPF